MSGSPEFGGEFVDIVAEHATVRGLEFRPRDTSSSSSSSSRSPEVAGLVLALPGSGGGLGPGLSRAPQPFASADRPCAHGGLYPAAIH